MSSFYLHLVSDSTGETVQSLSRACLALFPSVKAIERHHPLISSEKQMKELFLSLKKESGVVIFSLASKRLRNLLEKFCCKNELPMVSVLDEPLRVLEAYFGCFVVERSGAQHAMDEGYFHRIEAIHYTLSHDDGQGAETLREADVVLLGISRTSKTPTCFYLANRGIRAANVPLVCPPPLFPQLGYLQNILNSKKKRPVFFGLTSKIEHLIVLRRNRLLSLGSQTEINYIDPVSVKKEILHAQKIFSDLRVKRIIDVSLRSIEETASTIMHDLEEMS